ncbi:MAG TPA: RNA polymerase sigma factor [Acidimicrobiales bacterium]|nr:RNA polymerase sigma factor [Acidimicrobiales bacterium]
MAEDPDHPLVVAAQAGDRAALDALLRQHHDRVLHLCRRLAANEADALDATQEALIAIVRGLGRFDGRARFSTWVHRVATNACLDELRRGRRRPLPGLPEELDPSGGAVADPAGEVAVESLGDRAAIDEALTHLAPELRAAVVLRDLCDLDYAEIAEVLDIPPGTVRSRISRGRAQLARHLGPAPAAGNPGAPGQRPTSSPDAAPPTDPATTP